MKNVILLIDSSWSMSEFKDKIKRGIQGCVEKLKNDVNGVVYFSLAFFSEEPRYIVRAIPLCKGTNFDQLDIRIMGVTNLYDSIGSVLTEWFGREGSCKENYLYIVSDGDDTNSEKYTKEKIKEMCNQMISTGIWKIIQCDTSIDRMEGLEGIQYKLDDIDDLLDRIGGLKL